MGATLLAADARPQAGAPDADIDEAGAPAAVVGPPQGATAAERDKWLKGAIDRAVTSHPELAQAKIGISLVDLPTGRVLYARDADQPFNLASNVKLITTAAALATLGPEYRWRTSILAEKYAGGDTIAGDIWLRGTGDPSFDLTGLRGLARDLVLLGVKKIDGSLVIDDGLFDGVETPPAFDQKKEDAAFRAPVSAMSLNYNSVAVLVQPGAGSGAPGRVTVLPHAGEYLTITNGVTTVDGGRTALTITAKPLPGKLGRMALEVSGTIRTAEWEGRWFRKRIEHPAEFVGQALRVLLAEEGIKLRGRTSKRGAPPATAQAVATWDSAPLGILVRELCKRSNNFMAETVLKTMAAQKVAPATWPAGVEAVRAWLEGPAGLKPGSYRYDNGSGLYDSNRFTAAQITAVVRAAWLDFRVAPELLTTLAIAGVDGTLGARMIGTPAERWVRAKTGTLKNVTTLAGVAGAPGSTGAIGFAVLVNDIPAKVDGAGKAARALQDEVAQAAVLMSTP